MICLREFCFRRFFTGRMEGTPSGPKTQSKSDCREVYQKFALCAIVHNDLRGRPFLAQSMIWVVQRFHRCDGPG
jgi:hypothetical protein